MFVSTLFSKCVLSVSELYFFITPTDVYSTDLGFVWTSYLMLLSQTTATERYTDTTSCRVMLPYPHFSLDSGLSRLQIDLS